MTAIRALAAGLLAVAFAAPAFAKEEPVSFAEDVHPILKMRCVICHAPGLEGTEKSGLDLTTYEGVMKGTKHGSMIVPGDPLTSNLMVLIDGRADKSLQMPHGKKKLSSCDRELIRKWIKQGAKDN
ncbi:MAG: c-type cytochrome domain-containing protein [Solirubrobacterales bacterium]